MGGECYQGNPHQGQPQRALTTGKYREQFVMFESLLRHHGIVHEVQSQGKQACERLTPAASIEKMESLNDEYGHSR